MSHHLVTACMFCLLCASHTTCGSYMDVDNNLNVQEPHNVVRYDSDIPQKIPYELEKNHAEIDPFTETIQNHDIKKKNLSEQRKLRYLSKLHKIRTGKDYNYKKKREISIDDERNTPEITPRSYVEEIFKIFGDRDMMTMDIEGFNRMLSTMHFDRAVEGGVVDKIDVPGWMFYDSKGQEVSKVKCINSRDLIQAVGKFKTSNITSKQLIDEKTFENLCPILLYHNIANTSLERSGCFINDNLPTSKHVKRLLNNQTDKQTNTELDRSAYLSNQGLVWLYSSLSILVISACGLFGVAVIPIMHKTYYNHLLQFLVALAVGTLCGDALLHLLPHAMSPLEHSHGHTDSHSDSHSHSHEDGHNDSMWKGLACMMGVVFFYFTEKGLTVVAEWRKRRQKLNKENKLPARVRVLKAEGNNQVDQNNSKTQLSNTTSNTLLKLFNFKSKSDKDPTTKMCKHKYSEYPYCYDEIASDTHDDHHHRDGQIPAAPKTKAVSIVSSNALEPKEDPAAKEWLLNHTEDNDKKTADQSVEMNNISKEVKDGDSYTVILREHSRSHHGHSHSHGHVHAPPSSLSSVAWMVIMGDGLHNFTDGMAIGAAFASSLAGGFSTAVAVLCHELPHELGDFAVLLKAGMSVRRAVYYNALSSALCLAGMLCGILLGHQPQATRWVFAVAAGMFLYIALVDMMPELSSSHSKEGTFCQCVLQLAGLSSGVGIMLLIAYYEHDLQSLFDS